MSASTGHTIEQRIDDLLKHTGVWEQTKDTLRDLLAEHKAGTLDAEDASYIEGLHKKMFGGRTASAGSDAKPAPPRPRDIAAVKPANDDAQLASTRRGLVGADLIQALRQDIAQLVVPGDMADRSQEEQDLRNEILEALTATLDDIDAN
jgi:hypothetical protein